MAEVKKTEAKAKTETVKKAAEKKAEAVKATAKKAATTAKAKAETAKTAAKKTVKKAAAKKPAAKKAVSKDEIIVQVDGVNDVNVAAVVEAAKADYKAKTGKAARAVTVYVKPAEGVAYYTVAGKGSDDYKVEL